jgi:hypothetical protein
MYFHLNLAPVNFFLTRILKQQINLGHILLQCRCWPSFTGQHGLARRLCEPMQWQRQQQISHHVERSPKPVKRAADFNPARLPVFSLHATLILKSFYHVLQVKIFQRNSVYIYIYIVHSVIPMQQTLCESGSFKLCRV